MQSLLVCAYRSVSVETCESLIALLSRGNWHYQIRHGDAWIGRARSVVASQWYRQVPDDVFVMVDADIVFRPDDVERLAAQCKPGYEIVCADYPVHNGQFWAGTSLLPIHTGINDLIEMERVAAGCMAVHRTAIDALVETLPLCHASLPIAYWPLFIPFLDEYNGDTFPQSEDFAFSDRARKLGMHAWRDPSISVAHLSEFPVDGNNMAAMYTAGGMQW
jgi:hypothetical protein